MSDSELAHSRAERYLAHRVLGPQHEPQHVPPGLDPTIPARQRAAALHAALEVYERLGLFTTDEVRAWREAAAQDHNAVLPAESSPSALRMLERRWADVERVDRGEGPGSEASHRFSMAHLAASAAGLLSEQDLRAWSQRPQDRAAVLADDRRRLEFMRSTHLDDLRTVIPGPAARPSGRTVTSVEVFADALLVNWRQIRRPGEDEFLDLAKTLLTDELGTSYLAFSGGGGGGGSEQYGTVVFGPAPPPAAQTLGLVLGPDDFKISLASPQTIA